MKCYQVQWTSKLQEVEKCDIWKWILLNNFNLQTWKKRRAEGDGVLCCLFVFVRAHKSESGQTLYIISNYIYLSYWLCASTLCVGVSLINYPASILCKYVCEDKGADKYKLLLCFPVLIKNEAFKMRTGSVIIFIYKGSTKYIS